MLKQGVGWESSIKKKKKKVSGVSDDLSNWNKKYKTLEVQMTGHSETSNKNFCYK